VPRSGISRAEYLTTKFGSRVKPHRTRVRLEGGGARCWLDAAYLGVTASWQLGVHRP